jgi:ABC-type thiamine transport system ATPase subunit
VQLSWNFRYAGPCLRLTVLRRELRALLVGTGSGKSTLIKILAGVEKAESCSHNLCAQLGAAACVVVLGEQHLGGSRPTDAIWV